MRNQPQPFEINITTLPVFTLTDLEYSVFNSTSIVRAALTLEGHPDFDLEVIDNKNKVLGTTQVRRHLRTTALVNGVETLSEDITQTPYFAGPLLVESIPPHHTGYPRVRITKKNDKYLAINSMVLDLGNKDR